MKRHLEEIEGAIRERGYVYSFHYHLIWPTKYKKKIFTTEDLQEEMKDILQRIADASEVVLEESHVYPDYVHIQISFKPKTAPTDAVKNFKGASARIFFKKHPELKDVPDMKGKLWSNSYYMITQGQLNSDDVDTYIQNQYSLD